MMSESQLLAKSSMSNIKVHFSSKTDMWATPDDFYQRLHKVFRFETDVCATSDNAKCERFFSPEDDGLAQHWTGVCWMNPPYGRGIGEWIKKARERSKSNGATVVCLLPARVDTRWWHDHCARGEVYFIKGRLKFGDAKHSAPFPCAVVVFRPSVLDSGIEVAA
jgi:phage N-6-adenine-methyltransferase